jgi:F-type H+-transporting ATPase subunit delta
MPDRVDGYAQGIFEIARSEGSLDTVENELFQFSQVFEGNEQLREKLTDQSLPVEKRQAIVEDLLDRKAAPLTVNLISFLVGAGRARELPEIVNRLVERVAAERQRAVAEVRTAVDLDAEQRRRLTQALERATGKQIELKVIVDPSVMGGVVARVGDTVIDGSVRHRLNQLQDSLKGGTR